jgi:hypothetical protein
MNVNLEVENVFAVENNDHSLAKLKLGLVNTTLVLS